MSDSGSDAIKIWVTIILALFIAGMLFSVVMIGSKGVNSSTSKIAETATTLSEGEFTSYNGAVVNGDQVLGIISQFANKQCGIYVQTKKNGTAGTSYIGNLSSVNLTNGTATLDATLQTSKEVSDKLKDAQDRTNNNFLGSSAKFTGTILRDPDTNVIVGIAFVQNT